MTISIPDLNLNTEVLGVYQVANTWDTDWLSTQVGYLEGSAWPGSSGNAVLSAHVTLPSGVSGPFADLATLAYGDRVFVQQHGLTQVYEVQEMLEVRPTDIQHVMPTDEPTLTLITCSRYDEHLGTYTHRIVVRAKLVSTQGSEASLIQ